MDDDDVIEWTMNLPVRLTAVRVGDAWMISDYRVSQADLNAALLLRPLR